MRVSHVRGVLVAKKETNQDIPVIYHFIRDLLVPDTGSRTAVRDLHRLYVTYCATVNMRPVPDTTFSMYLGRFIHKTRVKGKVRFWCRIRDDIWETADDNAAKS
jgi:hypothetical protein